MKILPKILWSHLTHKSQKPGSNGGEGKRPKALGFQSGKDIKDALSKLDKLSKQGGEVKVNKDGSFSMIDKNGDNHKPLVKSLEQLDTKLNEVKSSKSKLAPPIVKKLDKKIITDDKVLEEKDICKCPSCFFSDSKFAFTKSMIGENWIKCPNCKMQFN